MEKSSSLPPPSSAAGPADDRRLLSRNEIMHYLGVSSDTLIKFLRDPRDPMPVLVLGSVYKFDLKSVLKWAERRSARTKGDVVERRRQLGNLSWAARQTKSADKKARKVTV